MNALVTKLGVRLPIVQAPMAGISTPAMAAAVSNAGGLGSIGVGNIDSETARNMIRDVGKRTDRPFNVNLFCHQPANTDPICEHAWLDLLAPEFARLGAKPPSHLQTIYQSFVTDDAMLDMLIDERPPVVSLHFGLPSPERLQRLHNAGVLLLATATSLNEGREVEAAGIDAVVAQGYEAGGHRGTFNPDLGDERLGTMALTRLLVQHLKIPVIAAGGIMDGAGIAAALMLGASAAQLGTAFIACDESAADVDYRNRLLHSQNDNTVMTRAISGRSARCLRNQLTEVTGRLDESLIPAYPIAYDAAKALQSAAKTAGEGGFGPHWAGQGAPLARAMSASQLMQILAAELDEALARTKRVPAKREDS